MFTLSNKTAVLALLVGLGMSLPAKAQDANFKDWSVSCDEAGYCEASTSDTKKMAGPLRIARLLKGNAVWEISVELDESASPILRPTQLRIAGQRTNRLSPKRDFATFGSSNRFHLVNSASLQPLFRRMIESRRMFASFSNGTTQRIEASYSLNGLSAALLYIDDKQQRLGSPRIAGPPTGDRVVAKAPKSSESPKSNEPIDIARIAEAEHERTKDREECDIDGAASYALGTAISTLDDKNSVAVVPCSAHAYNVTFNVYVIDHETKAAKRQQWAVYSGFTGWIGTDRLTNVNFDQETKELFMVHKGRGAGDCGMTGLWKWGEYGFKMVSFHAKDDCDGKNDDWPQVFPIE
ncbi:MAG: DUF1176 domain-containing protein [Hyphomicrobiales bacterium]